jgi:predicted membrane protein
MNDKALAVPAGIELLNRTRLLRKSFRKESALGSGSGFQNDAVALALEGFDSAPLRAVSVKAVVVIVAEVVIGPLPGE